MAKMRAVQVAQANGPLELVERDVPDPGRGTVRVKVQACGICHSDTLSADRVDPRPNGSRGACPWSVESRSRLASRC